jgi:hypothetical protein
MEVRATRVSTRIPQLRISPAPIITAGRYKIFKSSGREGVQHLPLSQRTLSKKRFNAAFPTTPVSRKDLNILTSGDLQIPRRFP